MIVELAAMMTERLQLFKTKRGRLPERIVVFRDGVSEGQFVTVLREECKLHAQILKILIILTEILDRSEISGSV